MPILVYVHTTLVTYTYTMSIDTYINAYTSIGTTLVTYTYVYLYHEYRHLYKCLY